MTGFCTKNRTKRLLHGVIGGKLYVKSYKVARLRGGRWELVRKIVQRSLYAREVGEFARKSYKGQVKGGNDGL
ncbi:hypothetical protein D3P08_06390 [Paenibacillus nanensis]|uniref:Uncharacterized protein n=1 Tax=Paenibacillus nanensis TaxID=393251 RepID=A0A3A1V028_9BACL|nr:hypothetical protein D3P08_06390 [Paenibacillus nanensis]